MHSEPLNNYIRMHRSRCCLSQRELAYLIGAGCAPTVARYELGQREPLLDTALALEALFGEPPRELFAGRFRQVEQFVAERARELAEQIRANEPPSAKRTAKLLALFELTSIPW
jgi:DNA-binding XRE family transcriptional regulator